MIEPSSIKLYTPVSVMYSNRELKCQLEYEMGAFQEKFCPFLSKDVRSVQKHTPDSKTATVERQPSDNFTQRCDLSLILCHHY